MDSYNYHPEYTEEPVSFFRVDPDGKVTKSLAALQCNEVKQQFVVLPLQGGAAFDFTWFGECSY